MTDNDLAELREADSRLTDVIHDEVKQFIEKTEEMQKPIYKTMATATKFIPNFIIANLAQNMLTPYIIGQVTHYLTPKESADIAKSLKESFLAEVTLHVEPALTAAIAEHLKDKIVKSVVRNMLAQNYIHRMAELADHLSEKVIRIVVPEIPDDKQAVIIENMTSMNKVEAIIRYLPDQSRERVRAELKAESDHYDHLF